MIRGRAWQEEWPLKVPFVISRSARTHVSVVVVEITDGRNKGIGECQPNSRYGETPEDVVAALNELLDGGMNAPDGAQALTSMAARNALDCALWDLKAKTEATSVWALTGRTMPARQLTAYTLSVGTPSEMAEAAGQAAEDGKRLLKLKLAGEGDDDRVLAVRQAAPSATLIADANEAWDDKLLHRYMPAMAQAGLALLEQPLPAGQDDMLKTADRCVPICADESCHTVKDLAGLRGKYDIVNIKLDKAGGLTPALELEAEARKNGMAVMVGCMLGTSLAMAPGLVVAAGADIVDLDGSLLLARDRDHKISVEDSCFLTGFSSMLWG